MAQPTNPTPASNSADSSAPPVDVQIVGAGLAGLIAANDAIDAGHTVRLIEKLAHAGGRAASQVKDGHTLNLGPHALYIGGDLDVALKRLDVAVEGAPPALKGARGVIGDVEGLLPGGPGSLLSTNLLSVRSKLKLAALMAGLPRIDTTGLGSQSAADWIDDAAGGRADLRALLRGLITLSTYSGDLDTMSADAAVANLAMGVADGVLYIGGGWQRLVDGLEARLVARAGHRLQRMTGNVVAVEPTADGWVCRLGTGAEHGSGPALHGRTLLLAAGSPQLIDRLTGTTDLAAAAGPPVEASVLDLGLRRRPDVGVYMDFTADAPPLYCSDHTVTPGMAPVDGGLVTVARYHRPEDADMDHETSRRLLTDHAGRAGITEADVVMDRYLHRVPVTWGMPRAATGGLPGRPGPAVAGHPGLFVAGDWAGDRGLLADASAASATEATGGITAHLADRRRPVGSAGRNQTGTQLAPAATVVGS